MWRDMVASCNRSAWADCLILQFSERNNSAFIGRAHAHHVFNDGVIRRLLLTRGKVQFSSSGA